MKTMQIKQLMTAFSVFIFLTGVLAVYIAADPWCDETVTDLLCRRTKDGPGVEEIHFLLLKGESFTFRYRIIKVWTRDSLAIDNAVFEIIEPDGTIFATITETNITAWKDVPVSGSDGVWKLKYYADQTSKPIYTGAAQFAWEGQFVGLQGRAYSVGPFTSHDGFGNAVTYNRFIKVEGGTVTVVLLSIFDTDNPPPGYINVFKPDGTLYGIWNPPAIDADWTTYTIPTGGASGIWRIEIHEAIGNWAYYQIKAIADGVPLDMYLSFPGMKFKLGSSHWDDDKTKGNAGVKYWYRDENEDGVADWLYLDFHVTYFVRQDHTLVWLGYFELDNGFTSDGSYDSIAEGNYTLVDVWGKVFKKGPYKGAYWWDNTIREGIGGFLWHGNCWGDSSKAAHSFIFADIEPDGANPQQGTVDLEKGMKLLFTSVFRVPADFHTTVTFNLGTYASRYVTIPYIYIIGSL